MNQIRDKVRKNEVWTTLTKTLTFVEADANAEGSTIALRERCSDELKCDKQISQSRENNVLTSKLSK